MNLERKKLLTMKSIRLHCDRKRVRVTKGDMGEEPLK